MYRRPMTNDFPKPTPTQYAAARKLEQTLRDIRDVDFYMPDVIDDDLSLETWTEWAETAYGKQHAAELAEQQQPYFCGRAACVLGWAMLTNIVPNTMESNEHALAEAIGLSVHQVNNICFDNMDKTRLEAADEIREAIDLNAREGIDH